MDATQFDTIARLFAHRQSRRITLAAGGFGLAAVAAGPLAVTAQDGTPQVATPAAPSDPHPSADAAQVKPEFLFVQPFTGGTWAPGAEGTYTLTLTGAAAHTIYFSDRPERIVGLLPTATFLDGLGFTPANPPNAALVVDTDAGQDVLVIELLNPVYDGTTLTYDAHILADYGETGLAHLARQQADDDFPASFTEGSLFIDDDACGFTKGQCYQMVNGYVTIIGDLDIDLCFDVSIKNMCPPCHGDGSSSYYGQACAEAYPNQCSYYSNGIDGWDCYGRGDGI
jgi:hypothetical protein